MSTFGCHRYDIESITRVVQRNLLIKEYCSGHFHYINLVDNYYRKFDSNAILIIIFIAILTPLLFNATAVIAEKYLASSMQLITNRFKISQALAAVTLLAFAGGAPDILASLANSGNEKGLAAVIGVSMGVYIFGSTLILAAVIFSVKEKFIAFPRLAVLKEIIFALVVISFIVLFGYFQFSGILLIIGLFLLYIAYIITTLYLNNRDQVDTTLDYNSQYDSQRVTTISTSGHINNMNRQTRASSINTKSSEHQFEMKIREVDLSDLKSNAETSFFDQIIEELVGEEIEVGQGLNWAHVVISAVGLFTIPQIKSPMMKGMLKYIPLTFGVGLIIHKFELGNFGLVHLIIISISSSIILFALEIAKASQDLLDTIYDAITIFAALAWIDFLSLIIVDIIDFLAFYFSVNEVILGSVLLSMGNSMGELFTAAALAKQGVGIMAALSVYSAQLLNLITGVIISTWASMKAGKTESFDIFSMSWFKEPILDRPPYPISSLFMILIIATSVALLVAHFVYLSVSKFTMGKKFGYALVAAYFCFFGVSMVFSNMSRE